MSTERKNHADDKVRAREAFAAYDIYTRRTKTSKQVQDLISSLDEQASENGWQLSIMAPPNSSVKQPYTTPHSISTKYTNKGDKAIWVSKN